MHTFTNTANDSDLFRGSLPGDAQQEDDDPWRSEVGLHGLQVVPQLPALVGHQNGDPADGHRHQNQDEQAARAVECLS